MPRNIERDKREADRRKNQLIEAGFRLFSQNGLETVTLSILLLIRALSFTPIG